MLRATVVTPRAQLVRLPLGMCADTDARTENIRRHSADAARTSISLVRGGGKCCGGDHLAMLSHRERETFLLIVAGYTIRESAAAMGIQAKTAENYRHRVLTKLGARCAVEAVHYAVEHGYLVAQKRPLGAR